MKSDKVKHAVGLVIANLLCLNTLLLIAHVAYIVSGGAIHIPVLLIQLGIFFVAVALFGTVLYADYVNNVLTADIISDWIKIKALWKTKKRKLFLLRMINTFIVFYHMVFPMVLYALIKHRHLKAFVLYIDECEYKYNKDDIPGIVMLNTDEQDNQKDVVPIADSDRQDHFVTVGVRAFVKNEESALYLQLSYPTHTLLEIFGYDNDMLWQSFMEIFEDNLDWRDSIHTERILKSFKMV